MQVDPQVLTQAIYRALAKAIWLALAIYAAVTFLDAITVGVLLFILATIFAIAIATPVNWLEKRKMPRALGTLIVIALIGGLLTGMGYLIVPRLQAEIVHLYDQLPEYSQSLSSYSERLLSEYPEVAERVRDPNVLQEALPSVSTIFARVGRYSLTLLSVAAGAIVVLTAIIFMVASPRPLIRGISGAVPLQHRDKFAVAFSNGSDAVANWLWANVIIGAIEAVAATVFLYMLGVPGALVWGLVTFFAELIPMLGNYLMAVPPTIVALAIDPTKALWVVVFYIALQQVVNALMAPYIRARTMRLHPVSEIFTVVALTLAFGILGAIIASPLLGFAKAFYNAFIESKRRNDPHLEERVEAILNRTADSKGYAA